MALTLDGKRALRAKRGIRELSGFWDKLSPMIAASTPLPIVPKSNAESPKATAETEFKLAESRRLTSMQILFPQNPDFVVRMMAAGVSVADARVVFKDLGKPQREEVKNVNIRDHQFWKLCNKTASERQLSLGDAIKLCAHENPELYEQYREAERNAPPEKPHRFPSK